MQKSFIQSLFGWFDLFKSKKASLPKIKVVTASAPTDVDTYWEAHTVQFEAGSKRFHKATDPFPNVDKSLGFLKFRSESYPLMDEKLELWGQHHDEIVLDYGCGPANDLVGFLQYSQAKKVIGVDVSAKALNLASRRLALHRFDLERIELIRISDATPQIPLDDNSVDYIYCEGVLHHISHPVEILREFYRVLRPGKRVNIMVYNRNSVFFHLEVAYRQMLVNHLFAGMTPDEAAPKTVDGVDCPLAHFYRPQEFAALCREAGFEHVEVDAYFARYELDLLKELGQTALDNERLAAEQRQFLSSLTHDDRGYPLYENKHAGYGGAYRLTKQEE